MKNGAMETILEMLADGATSGDIAEELGLTKREVFGAFQSRLDEFREEAADAMLARARRIDLLKVHHKLNSADCDHWKANKWRDKAYEIAPYTAPEWDLNKIMGMIRASRGSVSIRELRVVQWAIMRAIEAYHSRHFGNANGELGSAPVSAWTEDPQMYMEHEV